MLCQCYISNIRIYQDVQHRIPEGLSAGLLRRVSFATAPLITSMGTQLQRLTKPISVVSAVWVTLSCLFRVMS
jgi:hypothetical protein